MLNKQGPGKIDWTDYTWNPIAGCRHGCPYCYMKRMQRFKPDIMEPVFRSSYLDDIKKLKKPSKIFVGSSGDMWGKWMHWVFIQPVLEIIKNSPLHIFQLLTKNPHRYGQFAIPENCWIGTTVDGTIRTEKNIEDLLIATNGRCHVVRFISFEPLLARVDPDLFGIGWVIIGADSNRGAKKPPMEWAARIIESANNKGIPVWMKDNYGYPERIKQFPDIVIRQGDRRVIDE